MLVHCIIKKAFTHAPEHYFACVYNATLWFFVQSEQEIRKRRCLYIACTIEFVFDDVHCTSHEIKCVLFCYFLFCSSLFNSVLLCSVLLHFVLFRSTLFYFVLFRSALFYSILFCSILFCSLGLLLCSALVKLIEMLKSRR